MTLKQIITPISLDFDYTPGLATSRSLEAMAEKRILGQRSTATGKVYVPPRGSDPETGTPIEELVEVSNSGIITTFCVVNVPFMGQAVECPYVCALVLLDGADIAFQHLVQECAVDSVRMGMRVEAVWVDDADLAPTFESIRYFRPTGEPDAPYESYAKYI